MALCLQRDPKHVRYASDAHFTGLNLLPATECQGLAEAQIHQDGEAEPEADGRTGTPSSSDIDFWTSAKLISVPVSR